MNREIDHKLLPYLGVRVKRSLYNSHHALIIPANSSLTKHDLALIQSQGIVLTVDDIVETPYGELIESAIDEMKDVFEQVRCGSMISGEVITKNILPLILTLNTYGSIHEVLTCLKQNDTYTITHSIGVAIISRWIGEVRGLDDFSLEALTLSGLLHDIGKCKVPKHIIEKTGKLSDEEYQLIQKHTQFGYELIQRAENLPYQEQLALVALQHHERENGSGYPLHLIADEIDEMSKIVAIADVFHAMVSKRPYKDPIPIFKVLKEIMDCAYGLLDPESSLIFVHRIMSQLIGSKVMLSNGQAARIVLIHPSDPVRPLVICQGKYLDLRIEKDVGIIEVLDERA